MKRIGITQRVEVIPSYSERRDCLDQSWISLFEANGLLAIPIPNMLHDIEIWLKSLDINGIVLSGGNDLSILDGVTNPAPDRDENEKCLMNWARSNNMPVLGVCRGMQHMNVFLGGRLSPVEDHVAIRHKILISDEEKVLKKRLDVNSYHKWGIKQGDLAENLSPVATSEDGLVEACRHSKLPWTGIMWHPEREPKQDGIDNSLLTALFGDLER